MSETLIARYLAVLSCFILELSAYLLRVLSTVRRGALITGSQARSPARPTVTRPGQARREEIEREASLALTSRK
jgi:hypothetical protein